MGATDLELAAINANTDALNQILDEAKTIDQHSEQNPVDPATFVLGQLGTDTPEKLEVQKIVDLAAGATAPSGIEGDVQLNISSVFGSVVGFNFDDALDTLDFPMILKTRGITVGPANETVDFEGGDFTGTGFTTNGDQDWFVDNVIAAEGTFSARSGAIIGNQVSNLFKTVTLSDTENAISFSVFTDTEEDGDIMDFFIDDQYIDSFSGSTPFTNRTYPIVAGTYNLKWVYHKDPNVSTGADEVRIDFFQTFELFKSASFNGFNFFNDLNVFTGVIDFREKILGKFETNSDIVVNGIKIGNRNSGVNSNIIIDSEVNQGGELLTNLSFANTVIGANSFGAATDAKNCSGLGDNILRDVVDAQFCHALGSATLRGVVDGFGVVGLGRTISDLLSNLTNTFFWNDGNGLRHITISTVAGAELPEQTIAKINALGAKAILTKEAGDSFYASVDIASSGVSGSIQFSNGSGGFLSDGTNLFYDDANNRLGIGIAVPTEKLDVLGNIKTSGFFQLGLLSGSGSVEGKLFYDTDDKALSLKTDITGSTQSVGQEFWVRVVNKTGVSIPDGSVVCVIGFDVASGRATIGLALADVLATADPIGFTTNTMANDAEGFVTTMGFLNDLDTSSFSAGDTLFLSATVAGGVTTTKPLIAVLVGFATKINASTGQILTTISRRTTDSPIFLQLSDSVNQKPVVTTPVVITFDTNDDIRGITHSTSLATEDIIIDFDGTYTVIAQPQVEKNMGGGTTSFHMWARIGSADSGTTTSVSVANPSTITTTNPHGLTNGQTVEIINTTTTPSINAQHVITVTGASTFTIPVNVTAVADGVGDWRRVLDVNDDVANSNVELNLTGSTDSSVIPLIFTRDFIKGEKLNLMQSISSTGDGVGLVAKTPAGEPGIPSIIFAMNKN